MMKTGGVNPSNPLAAQAQAQAAAAQAAGKTGDQRFAKSMLQNKLWKLCKNQLNEELLLGILCLCC